MSGAPWPRFHISGAQHPIAINPAQVTTVYSGTPHTTTISFNGEDSYVTVVAPFEQVLSALEGVNP